jgi:TPR repeat protein
VFEDMQIFTLAHKWYKRLEITHKLKRSVSANITVYLGLGLLSEYGDGVEQDYQKALEHYTKLEYHYLDDGRIRLSLMYYYGKGVAVDYRESFYLFKRVIYGPRISIIVPPNIYKLNRLNGNDSLDNVVYCLTNPIKIDGEAHYYLGLQYKYGQGVPNDQGKAQYNFGEAFSCGCKRAEFEIDDHH